MMELGLARNLGLWERVVVMLLCMAWLTESWHCCSRTMRLCLGGICVPKLRLPKLRCLCCCNRGMCCFELTVCELRTLICSTVRGIGPPMLRKPMLRKTLFLTGMCSGEGRMPELWSRRRLIMN